MLPNAVSDRATARPTWIAPVIAGALYFVVAAVTIDLTNATRSIAAIWHITCGSVSSPDTSSRRRM